MKESLELALALRDQGISAIPLHDDKTPRVASWKQYQDEPASEEKTKEFFSNGAGIGILSGKVQCLDVDTKHQANIWDLYLERVTAYGLLDALNQCVIQSTQSGGKHVVFKCDAPLRNVKLAKNKEGNVILETRGYGGYFMSAPSNGYKIESGSLYNIPLLAEDDRDDLLAIARSFNEESPRERKEVKSGGTKAGDAYDAQADVLLPQLLLKHHWTPAGQNYWTRPNKTRGISASWGHVPDRFYVFSTSTEFEAEKVYKAFAVYATLEHGGDFKAAAAQLGREGFGAKLKKPESFQEWSELISIDEKSRGESDSPSKIDSLIEECKIDFDKSCPPPDYVFKIGGVGIATNGNIVGVTSQAGSGKSSFEGAMIAALMEKPMNHKADTLGVVASGGDGSIVFIDTEQSEYHSRKIFDQARRRAELEKHPTYLSAYRVAGKSPDMVLKMLDRILEIHENIRVLFVDLCSDLIEDFNCPIQTRNLIRRLREVADQRQMVIVASMHLNPGQVKPQGHLGTALLQKAETVLVLVKDHKEQVSTVLSLKARNGPIDPKQAPRFKWDEAKAMHLSVPTVSVEKQNEKLKKLRALAATCFNGNDQMRYKELIERIVKKEGTSESTAENRVRDMRNHGIVEKSGEGKDAPYNLISTSN